ncbi:HNH endonuclease [Burkholderia vietnamiensis]|uniref:HNH endonuclease n=1 Tax=Burkholderia vietnamiensis (strain G4 / LMG 22486) TaxID=269482 RepID=A4JMK3_BURVG|nr:HNH endonuclease [Burkholderia vietnamiensis]ABO57506.1 HNH endonuclease [Burkholderia vietnamiensis G4]MCB4342515.1 HNH endonuclease [Burkholderia vietnamiensis]
MNTAPIEFLREALSYDPESGELVWKVRPRPHFNSDRGHRVFNTMYAGRTAGHVLKSTGYRLVNLGQYGFIGVHRIAMAITTGKWADVVDHINGDPMDNRISNLRACTKAENGRNRRRNKGNRIGLKGVSSHPNTSRWVARIQHGGKQHYLGMFDTPELAHAAYVAAAKRLHGEFANAG